VSAGYRSPISHLASIQCSKPRFRKIGSIEITHFAKKAAKLLA
jgi:hypothetical protein